CGAHGPANERPGVDAGWRVLFAFQHPRPRAPQAERYILGAAVRVVEFLFLLPLCVQGLCQTPDQAPLRRPSVDSSQILAGTFESAVRGDNLFADRTATNGVPLFTLRLETNGAYSVFCASIFTVPLIDGGGSLVPGYEFGTW